MTPAEASRRFIVGQTVWFWTPTRGRLLECVLMRHDAEINRWEANVLDSSGQLDRARWSGIRSESLFATREDAERDEVCRVLAGQSPAGWPP